jgi:hypothetical protein
LPFEDRFDFGGVHGNAILGNDIAEEIDRGLKEAAFFRFGPKTMFSKAFQDLLDVFDVILSGFAVDQDVVQIDDDGNVQEFTEDFVHELLKRSGGVCQAEWHDQIFEETVTRSESGLPFFSCGYPYKVVCAAEVDLGEILGVLKSVQVFLNEGKWIAVLDSDLVQAAVVHAKAK